MTTRVIESENALMRAAFDQRRYVWLSFGDKTFMGFIVGLSDSLVLIHRFRDFEDAGHAVIRRTTIEEVDCSLSDSSPSLRFFEHMMAGEGLLERVGISFDVPLDSFAAAANAVRTHDELVLFHRGPNEPEDGDLHVGLVVSANDLHIRTKCVSAGGEWHAAECELETPKLQRIEFGSPYLLGLKKYAPAPTVTEPLL